MQYSPRAIATVATEAVQHYIDTARPYDRELVARVWADLTHEVVFDSVAGRVEHVQDAYSWNLVFCDVGAEFDAWLGRHGLYGSLVERVGRVVLDSCRSFVGLERCCEPVED